MQDGSQQLGDLPVLGVGEHKDLHCRADVGVLLAVISAVAGCAVTLERRRGRTVHGVKQRASGCNPEAIQGFPLNQQAFCLRGE